MKRKIYLLNIALDLPIHIVNKMAIFFSFSNLNSNMKITDEA